MHRPTRVVQFKCVFCFLFLFCFVLFCFVLFFSLNFFSDFEMTKFSYNLVRVFVFIHLFIYFYFLFFKLIDWGFVTFFTVRRHIGLQQRLIRGLTSAQFVRR